MLSSYVKLNVGCCFIPHPVCGKKTKILALREWWIHSVCVCWGGAGCWSVYVCLYLLCWACTTVSCELYVIRINSTIYFLLNNACWNNRMTAVWIQCGRQRLADGWLRVWVRPVRDNIECDYKHIKLIIEMINPRKTINFHSLIKSHCQWTTNRCEGVSRRLHCSESRPYNLFVVCYLNAISVNCHCCSNTTGTT